MNAAVGVIESRVNGTGNSGAQVQPQGTDLLIVTVPGKGSQQTIQLVSSTALLMFRQVLLWQPSGATTLDPARRRARPPRPAPPRRQSATSSARRARPPAPPAPRRPPPRSSRRPAPAPARASASADRVTAAARPARPSRPGQPSASPSSSASSTAVGNPSLVHKDVLALFNKLTASRVTRRPGSPRSATRTPPLQQPDVQVVACGNNGGSGASTPSTWPRCRASRSPRPAAGLSTHLQPVAGQPVAEQRGRRGLQHAHLAPVQHLLLGRRGDQNSAILNQVAIALDGNVVSSPQIQQRHPRRQRPDHRQLHPGRGTQLQNELKFGSVPLDLKTLFVTSVSAQVGRNQLDAGLIAAAIGLLLVVVYSFLYYRGLGIVSVSQPAHRRHHHLPGGGAALPVPELHPRWPASRA